MPNEVNIYQPRYLAEVVRQAPPVHTYFRDTFFTRIVTFATERVDIDLVKGDRRMAAFVHPRAGGQVLRTTGYETKSYKPPLISPTDISYADQFMQRMPGETLYSGKTPAQRAAERLIEDYNRLNDAATRREEWMCAKAIIEGEIPIVGIGGNESVDFQFTNKIVLTGSDRWGQTGAAILHNLEDWASKVLVEGYANVDTVIMGKTALRAFLEDEKIRAVLDNRRVEMGIIQPRDLPNGVAYIGHLNRPNVDIYTCAEVFLDDWTDPDSPEVKPLVPDNTVILISSAASFMMAYGACTYIDDASKQWVTAETSRMLISYVAHNPDRRMIELQAHPLPVPDKVDSWLVATVC